MWALRVGAILLLPTGDDILWVLASYSPKSRQAIAAASAALFGKGFEELGRPDDAQP